MKGLCSGARPQLPTSYALCLADSRFLQSIGKVFSRHWKATRQSRSSAGKSFCCSGSLLMWRLINSHLSWGARLPWLPPPETIRTRRGRKEWGAWIYSVIQIIFYKVHFGLRWLDWNSVNCKGGTVSCDILVTELRTARLLPRCLTQLQSQMPPFVLERFQIHIYFKAWQFI